MHHAIQFSGIKVYPDVIQVTLDNDDASCKIYSEPPERSRKPSWEASFDLDDWANHCVTIKEYASLTTLEKNVTSISSRVQILGMLVKNYILALNPPGGVSPSDTILGRPKSSKWQLTKTEQDAFELRLNQE